MASCLVASDEVLRALAGEGLSLRQIAARAGGSHETVRQRLRAVKEMRGAS
jgi:DNA-binding CsgD family transcriptional regulator